MGKDEIISRVTSYINLSLNGGEAEDPKVDFKRCWYDLQNAKSLMEFLKDTSAIANTFGPDGFIIIGYDDKSKTFQNCKFTDSGRRDTSEIPDVINKNVDRMFSIHYYEAEILGHQMGILHIPPSIDKPHVIRNYKTFKGGDQVPNEHRIFVRKGTNTRIASKYDLDLMYYDRKNIQPEYELYVSFSASNIIFFQSVVLQSVDAPLGFKVTMYVENTGKRPVSIPSFSFNISEFVDPSDHELYGFTGFDRGFESSIIQSGVMGHINCEFSTVEKYRIEKRMEIEKALKTNFRRLGVKTLLACLSNGDQVACHLAITK